MTEAEWRACSDPVQMLAFLQGKAGDRKLRLFACGVCHRLRAIMPPVGRNAVAVAESQSDGSESASEVAKAERQLADGIQKLNRNGNPIDPCDPAVAALWVALLALGPLPPHDLRKLLTSAVSALMSLKWWLKVHRPADVRNPNPAPYSTAEAAHRGESAAVANLFREVIGNPFRPVSFSPSWRTDTALSLAQTMYDGRDFSAMPVLADALQDAGCEDEQILSHCRGDGPHARGCWVVDLVLGKE